MTKDEILRVLDAARLVIATRNVTDKEAAALFLAAAKATNPKKRRRKD